MEFMRQVVRHIKIEPAVKTETKRIAISVVAMSVVMEVVFLALGRFDSTVLFGNLLGGGHVGDVVGLIVFEQRLVVERADADHEELVHIAAEDSGKF